MKSTPTKISIGLNIIALLSLASLHGQTVISVNVADAGGNVFMAPTDLAGVAADLARVGNWNNLQVNTTNPITVSGASLAFDDGSTVGAGVQLDYDTDRTTFAGANGSTNDARMFSVYNQPRNGESITVDLSGIPFSSYAIYVYTKGGSDSRGGSIELSGGPTFYNRGNLSPDSSGNGYSLITTTSYNSSDPSAVGIGNYVKFADLSGTDQTFTLSVLDMGDATQRMEFSGFQIVQIPESSHYAMLAGASILVLAVIRRRKLKTS